MKIYYRILGVDEAEQQFNVRYWSDSFPEDALAIDFVYPAGKDRQVKRNEDGTPTRCRTDFTLTLWKNDATEEDIRKQIIQSAPISWFSMKEKVKRPDIDTSMNNVHTMPREGSFDDTDLEQEFGPRELSEADIDKLLEEIKKKQNA